MDPTETLVADFLGKQGYKEIIYEPDGNVPPDFLVDSRIAVEVRRLNQSYDTSVSTEGLEQVAIPLRNKVTKLCLSLGAPKGGISWFVFFRFSRPVEHWKTLEPKLRGCLLDFVNAPIHKESRFTINRNFELEIFQASTPHPTFFIMGGSIDRETGGWLLGELQKNLQTYIDEKAKKIEKFRSRYPVWWLALVDRIAYGLDDFDLEQFKATALAKDPWNRVIVIDPRNNGRFVEI